jgi:hypothetical protein
MRGAAIGLPSPLRELMALSRMNPRERDGKRSFWGRPSRALPDRDIPRRENNASRPSPVGGVNELVKYADVVPGALPAAEKTQMHPALYWLTIIL